MTSQDGRKNFFFICIFHHFLLVKNGLTFIMQHVKSRFPLLTSSFFSIFSRHVNRFFFDILERDHLVTLSFGEWYKKSRTHLTRDSLTKKLRDVFCVFKALIFRVLKEGGPPAQKMAFFGVSWHLKKPEYEMVKRALKDFLTQKEMELQVNLNSL